ncbi:MAG: hypothetical protein ACLTCJ_09755 [Gemmiger formicilis]|uniref:hypothetical protein n=1 Tax=Gemmiger formicilis TaxID=745368 RepID=UPI003A436950
MATALGLALSDAAWGIGAPGSVDVDTGTVLYANNLNLTTSAGPDDPRAHRPARLCG